MLKKKILIGLISAAIIIGFTGCSNTNEVKNTNNTEISTEETTKQDTEVTKDKYFHIMRQSGFKFNAPEIFTKNLTNFNFIGMQLDENGLAGLVISYATQPDIDELMKTMKNQETMSEEEKTTILNAFYDSEVQMIQLQVYKKETLETKNIEDISKMPNNDFMGEQDGYVYYISYNNETPADKFEDYDQKLYKEGLINIENLKKSYELVPIDNNVE